MLYTGHAKYEEGRESNHHAQPLYFLNLYLYILHLYFCKALRLFYKKPFQKPKRMQTITNLNNASEASARSLWIRTHSIHQSVNYYSTIDWCTCQTLVKFLAPLSGIVFTKPYQIYLSLQKYFKNTKKLKIQKIQRLGMVVGLPPFFIFGMIGV